MSLSTISNTPTQSNNNTLSQRTIDLAEHSKAWKSSINSMELRQLYGDVDEIRYMKCDLDKCNFCYYCNFAYRPAFFVYPKKEEAPVYQPMCIPCVVKYAFPNDTTLSSLHAQYNNEQVNTFVAQYYSIVRYLIRTTDIPPIQTLLSSQTCATTPIYPLDKKYYSFSLSAYDEKAEEA